MSVDGQCIRFVLVSLLVCASVGGNCCYQLLFFLYPTDFGLFLSVLVLSEQTSESVAADGATGR